MEAGLRADLESSRILTLPKRDTQRAVLSFVKGLRSFSKVHAAEGKAHMATWDGKEARHNPGPPRIHHPQSCGFATPVLKPRRALAQKESLVQDRIQTRNAQSSNCPAPSPKSHSHTGAKSLTKTGRVKQSTEAPSRREDRNVKRGRELQSDEEKRLRERRENKRMRREIMRNGSSQKQAQAHDDQSEEKSKSKKSKKMPVGLALMYGFTATNVGKNRLTVKPSFRSGVFGKGKVSAQVQVGRSKQKGKNLAFSEEEFLKSATRERRHGKEQRSSSSSQSSNSSFERSDDGGPLRQKPKGRTSQPSEADTEAALVQRRKKIKPLPAEPTNDMTEQISLYSPSKGKAQSITWDIEKDDSVLPTDSSVLTRGRKPSTILLNVTQKQWTSDLPLDTNKVSGVKESSAQQQDITKVSREEQSSPSLISSVRPSESPSQVAHAPAAGVGPQEGMVSKYFADALSPQARSTGEFDTEKPVNAAMSVITLLDPAYERPGISPVDFGEQRAGVLQTTTDCEQLPSEIALQDTGLAQGIQRPLTHDGLDWLLSDPISMIDEGLNRGPENFDITELSEAHSDVSPDGPVVLQEEELFLLYENFQFDSEYDHFPTPGKDFCDEFLLEKVYPDIYDHDHPLFQSEVYEQGHAPTGSGQALPFQDLTRDGDSPFGEFDDTSYFSDCVSSLSNDSIELLPSGSPGGATPRSAFLTGRSPPLLRFNEGHCLLSANAISFREVVNSSLDSAEADVARRLAGHWAPQRY
ncbi:hypothetical protein D9756_000695 [Leucocoprinus leucothites]|uniref:Uncharacterized protein n=1 Tax=Leucocoprinus leucothites TaxID=201217 RepID=A0A8H5GEI0_9AGAR|nr:hypothetical protein D9756_000695 [Leucoagaricus leucothites]